VARLVQRRGEARRCAIQRVARGVAVPQLVDVASVGPRTALLQKVVRLAYLAPVELDVGVHAPHPEVAIDALLARLLGMLHQLLAVRAAELSRRGGDGGVALGPIAGRAYRVLETCLHIGRLFEEHGRLHVVNRGSGIAPQCLRAAIWSARVWRAALKQN